MKSILLLLILSLLWGSSFLWIKGLLDVLSPASIVFIRCAFGLLVLLPLIWKMRLKFTWWPGWKFIGIVSLGAALPWTVLSIALQRIDTTISGILNATTPLFAVVFSIVLFQTRPLRSQLLSLSLGFFAVTVLLLTSSGVGGQFSWLHALLMLFVTACYALNSIGVGRYFKDVPASFLGFWTMLVSMVLNGVISLILQPRALLELAHPNVLGAFLVLGCLSSGVGYMIFYWITSNGGVLVALMVTFIAPFVTILLGVGLLGEPLHWGIGAGLGLMIFSLIAMNWETLKARRLARRNIV
ncbi:DMT family transporter [Chryseomicrobium palamuruense]|uniref:DMT family transporter n=1 Tax=Chryseomicrobium palamuruense TaxID=682973 RepID=A0ABV8UUJ4_9BACL